ncbi:MAG: putative baseplate assembly protein [Thermoanaerobaculia bacterium]
MSATGCGCCSCLSGAGHHPAIFNRPGLPAIRYRVATHPGFFDAMIRRLSVAFEGGGPYSLHRLTTREGDDPAIALLDAWACVGDILTFYQERIANESFLGTATERRSILELGRLVGYTLKPGVAASVYLAYTLDDDAKPGLIPAGTKAQSIPGADEKPQMFETSADTEVRAVWNALKPRMRRPQDITLENVLTIDSVWIAGTSTRIEKREPIFFVFEADILREVKDGATNVETVTVEVHAVRRARETIVDEERNRTRIVLETVRPYYTELYALVLKTWLKMIHPVFKDPCKRPDPVPEPGPVIGQVMTVKAKSSKPRKKKKTDAENVSFAQAALLDVDILLRDILLGVPRLNLQFLHGDKTGHLDITALLAADDRDAALVPGPPLPRSAGEFLGPLVRPRSVAPASEWQLGRSLNQTLAEGSDLVPRLLAAFFPQLDATIYTALANITNGTAPYSQLRSVHVLRRQARVFGYNAPAVLFEDRPTSPPASFPTSEFVAEQKDILHLASPENDVAVGSYVVTIGKAGARARKVREAQVKPRRAYGVTGDSTRLVLSREWWCPLQKDDTKDLDVMIENLITIRDTNVLIVNEQLTLAQQIVDRPIGRKRPEGVTSGESEMRIELDGVIAGLAAGRRVIVTGERADSGGTRGVIASELAMVANVEQQTDSGPGGTSYSILELAPKGLAYEYKRDTVRILGNVVKATHGETRREILGGGNASQSLQTFSLNQAPLTFVAAPTIDGTASTLVMRINDVQWHETDSFAGESPAARVFTTKTADSGKVSVTFGTGREGARLPTGSDNVRATYRTGIGIDGNVRAGQIATAVSRPLGVRDVINPIEASGGADPESRDDARRTIPVSLQALGRIVSVRDYADFVRTFAGISKASAAALSDGRRRLVLLTIGGAGDIEIGEDSDLFASLDESLRKYGDPYQPFVVMMREKIVIAGAAKVRVDPDYLWADVAPKIRAALLATFSYDRREFGQAVYPSEVVATIQNVPGVAWVDLDVLGGVRVSNLVRFGQGSEPRLPRLVDVQPILPRLERTGKRGLRPAQIAYLPPKLADLFILTEIPA